MMVDGVAGPEFDELRDPVLSPRGGRVAYVGRRGAAWIPVVDGKEGAPVAQVGAARTRASRGDYDARLNQGIFVFSDDGPRVAYVATTGDGAQQVVTDGVAGQSYASIGEIAFAGRRLAYVANTPAHKAHLVIDGKPGVAFTSIHGLQVSTTGRAVAIAQRERDQFVVVDHAENGPYAGIEGLTLAPDGRVAYVAAESATTLRYDALDRLSNLRSPTLVIVGEQDLLTPPWICREVADRIPGSEFEIINGAGSSHVVPIERPDEFNRLVTTFLLASNPLHST